MRKEADLGAGALIDIALETYRAEILPALPADRRYAGAMLANVLEIAQRTIGSAADERERRLLDQLYGEGKGSMADLVRDIRSGRLDDRSTPAIRPLLRRHLEDELSLRNPRFLASRKA